MYYIYKTTNIITNKIYIGKRVYREKDDDWYLGSGLLLKKSIKKYGRKFFKKEILEWCNSEKELSEREKFWIKYYSATNLKIGYNLSLGGDGGNVGILAYEKISLKLKNKKKKKSFGENVSKKLKGKKRSDATKEKIRKTLSGRKRPKVVGMKISTSIKEKYKNGWKSPVKRMVYQYDKKSGIYLNSYNSATEAGRLLKIHRKGITNNCNNKSKTSGGFVWSFDKKLKTKI
jgi:group I intron endonuclease